MPWNWVNMYPNVTNVADINGKSGYRFNLGHDDYISDAAFEGDIAEILIFSKI